MKCNQCQTDNKDGAKFCAKCGAAMPVTHVQPTAIESKNCPQCGKALKSDAKFCGGCGYKFLLTVAQAVKDETHPPKSEIHPVQPEVKAAPPVQQAVMPLESASILTKFCTKCGKVLKDDARFCSECGHNFVQPAQVSVPASIENENAAQHVRQPVRPEIKVVEPLAKVAAQDASAIVVETVQEKIVASKPETFSAEKKGIPVAVIAGGVLIVVALLAGGGFYYYKSHAVRGDVAAKVEVQPVAPSAVITVPASAIPPVSEPVTTAVSAPVAATVVEPEPVKASHVVSVPKKPRESVKQKGETQDDRKLLNAIDQYMDKQH